MNLSLAEIPLPVCLIPMRRLTDDELLRFCAVNDSLRVEQNADGALTIMTPAGNVTSRKNSYLIQVLGTWADGDGRGYAFDSNTGFTLPDGSMRSPDAAWVEATRWDALPKEDKERFSHIVPDFIVELRSPSDRLTELEAKMEQWMANGVQLAWLLDPIEEEVTVYRAASTRERHQRPGVMTGDGIMTGFELSMARIWQ